MTLRYTPEKLKALSAAVVAHRNDRPGEPYLIDPNDLIDLIIDVERLKRTDVSVWTGPAPIMVDGSGQHRVPIRVEASGRHNRMLDGPAIATRWFESMHDAYGFEIDVVRRVYELVRGLREPIR